MKTPYQNLELLQLALTYYGESEYPGKDNNNDIIVDLIKQAISWATNDEIPWCSFFIHALAEKAGLESPPDDKVGLARSWLTVGEEIEEPEIGDLVIFWRGSPNAQTGHVGIYINKIGGTIYVLGGNQRNQVNISGYSESRLLGYRRLNCKQEKH